MIQIPNSSCFAVLWLLLLLLRYNRIAVYIWIGLCKSTLFIFIVVWLMVWGNGFMCVHSMAFIRFEFNTQIYTVIGKISINKQYTLDWPQAHWYNNGDCIMETFHYKQYSRIPLHGSCVFVFISFQQIFSIKSVNCSSNSSISIISLMSCWINLKLV